MTSYSLSDPDELQLFCNECYSSVECSWCGDEPSQGDIVCNGGVHFCNDDEAKKDFDRFNEDYLKQKKVVKATMMKRRDVYKIIFGEECDN